MREKLRDIIKVLAVTPTVIWRQRVQITTAFVCIALSWLSVSYVYHDIDKQRVENADASTYLNYTSFVVSNSREGEDVTYTVCRDHDQAYTVTGIRSVYIVPAGKTDKDRIFLYNKAIEGSVNDKCQSYIVKDSEHHFSPGRYELTLNLGFTVQYGVQKSAYVKSNIFTVYAQPATTTDTQAQLDALSKRVDDLEKRLSESVDDTGQPATTTPTPQSSQSAVTNTPQAAATTLPSTSTTPKPTTASAGINIPIVTPLLQAVGGLLGGLGL